MQMGGRDRYKQERMMGGNVVMRTNVYGSWKGSLHQSFSEKKPHKQQRKVCLRCFFNGSFEMNKVMWKCIKSTIGCTKTGKHDEVVVYSVTNIEKEMGKDVCCVFFQRNYLEFAFFFLKTESKSEQCLWCLWCFPTMSSCWTRERKLNVEVGRVGGGVVWYVVLDEMERMERRVCCAQVPLFFLNSRKKGKKESKRGRGAYLDLEAEESDIFRDCKTTVIVTVGKFKLQHCVLSFSIWSWSVWGSRSKSF
eukprot:TRINITY_DN143_c0_g1_i1.p1 TRINITY_DN143_c0_g1~~TRINITY_DN143_c0_g1_i1.p1  ORF type:complete len:250 (+),score=-3.06 TRINITY_DN143_c0_g1_i1:374-1123(+)